MTDVKARFAKKPLLVSLNLKKLYILETNALNYAIRNTLRQKVNGKLYPVIFYFRKFTNVEFNYEIYNKKLLIIIAIFKKWKFYFKKSKYSVTIYNDYKNLTWFTMTKKLN